jgi:DnaJ-class molecular chaperone
MDTNNSKSQFNYYEILGVNNDSSKIEIKKAYRKLCLDYHPDKNDSDEAKTIFTQISKAYHVLMDDDLRKNYDESGISVEGNIIDPFEIFNEMIKENDSVPNVIEYVDVNTHDLFNGLSKMITIERYSPCSVCDATGTKSKIISNCPKCSGRGVILEFIDDDDKPFKVIEKKCDMCNSTGIDPDCELCSNCNGDKFIIEKLDIEIDIPSGAYNEYYITYDNEGNYIPETKTRSDLIIVINEIDDEQLSRGYFIKELKRLSMADVVIDIDISFEESLNGIYKKINYFDHYINIKAKGIIMNQDIYVLKKYGMTVIDENDTREYGDLFVRFNVQKPKISSKQLDKILKILNYQKQPKIKDCEKLITINKFIQKSLK